MLRTLNLDGDAQADLRVHGGPTKAAYAYPAEHYDFWRHEFPGRQLGYGMFGENFTTEGLFETEINVGDQFRIGKAKVVVTEPRLPCYKLAIRFGRAEILKRFLPSRRSGFYVAVLEEGSVQPGDTIERMSRDESGITSPRLCASTPLSRPICRGCSAPWSSRACPRDGVATSDMNSKGAAVSLPQCKHRK